MMNVIVPSQECSSGCESGWTLYLEHSTSTSFSNGFTKTSFGENQRQKMVKFEEQDDKNNDGYLFGDQQEDEDEDLSMVSDASSGPPHFDHDIDEEEEEGLWYRQEATLSHFPNTSNSNSNGGRLRKQCMKSHAFETQCRDNNNNKGSNDFELDDSASSHIFTPKKNIGGIVHHVQNNQTVSFDKFIDYSSQGYSATHVQVGFDGRRSRSNK